MAALEQELGVSLIERERGAARLTAIGERVAAHARVAVAAAEAARQEAAAARGLATSHVRLGSFPSVSSRLIPRVLRRFRELYPGVTVTLFEGTDEEVRDWLVTGVVDVGLVTEPHPALHTVRLQDDPYVAVMVPDDPLAKQDSVSARDLAAVPFILPASGCERVIEAFFAQSGVPLCPAYAVRDTATILAMVREGLGVTVLAALSIPEAAAGLHTLSLAPNVTRELTLGVSASVPMAPATQALIDQAVGLLRRDHAVATAS